MGNTIGGCSLGAVAEESLPGLQLVLAPLNALTTDLSDETAPNFATISTRYPTNPTAADFSGGTSSIIDDVTTTEVKVTLNTHYGFAYGFTDNERSLSAVGLNEIFIQPAIQALGKKIFDDIWNLFVAAKFTTSSAVAAASFDRDDLADLDATLTGTKYAPQQGRSFICNPTYYASLVKSLNSAEIPGITEEKAEGMVPRVAGFDVYKSSEADDNSENLGGVAMQKAAVCFAARRVDSGGALNTQAEVEDVVVPGIGMPVQFRRYYDNTLRKLVYSVEALYGIKEAMDYVVRVTTS